MNYPSGLASIFATKARSAKIDYALLECKCCGTIYHLAAVRERNNCPLCFGDELVETTVRTMIEGSLFLAQRQRDMAFNVVSDFITSEISAGVTVALVAKTYKNWMMRNVDAE